MSGLVVGTSAVVALLTGEVGGDALAEALDAADPRLMAAPTAVELGIVLEARYGTAGTGLVERFLRDAAVQVIGFERDHADRAMDGWRRFGKGRHPAALNLGDCFAYGLAAATGHPVLCTGDDFAATDIAVVQPDR